MNFGNEISESEELYWRDYAEEKAYQTILGEMIMNAGYTERAAHQLAWAIRRIDYQEAIMATGRMTFADLQKHTVKFATRALPDNLCSLVRHSFKQAAPHMKRRNALVHASWVSSQPRVRLSTREWTPQVVELREIEDLSINLLAAGFQFGVARTQVLHWQGKTPLEEDFREIQLLDQHLQR